MDKYCVNKNASAGKHEVHNLTQGKKCLPKPENRVDLGEQHSCDRAVSAAEEMGYDPADGCGHCCGKSSRL